MTSDQPALTARTRLPVIVVLVLCTGLSVVFYLRVPFGQMQEISVGNVKPMQRHINRATNRQLIEEQLRNTTQNMKTSRPSSGGTADHETVTPDFMETKRKEQNERKAIIRQTCKQYKGDARVDVRKHPPARIYMDDEHKALYCAVPKIASTSWKKVFLVLVKAFKTTGEISQFYTNRAGKKQLRELRDVSPYEIDGILKTYTKFMFARHPFSRVLSAFKNKLAPNSTFERAVLWQRSVGKRIIDKYRGKERQQSAGEYDLTFNEFIQYLIDPEANSNNLHWAEIHKQCLPCQIDYDVIGKFETLQTDAKYILNLIGAPDVAFPGSDSSSPTGSSNQSNLELHFKGVPLVDLQKLYERFRFDFQLFGYSPPTLAFKGS